MSEEPRAGRLAILAPVPCIHLASALKMAAVGGARIAFGTNAATFFEGDMQPGELAIPPGTPVLIYASRPEFGAAHLAPRGLDYGFVATLVDWRRADRRGRHPEHEQVRPLSTDDDGPAIGFWEVETLAKLPSAVPLGALRSNATMKPITTPPRGPMLVRMPSGDREHLRP
jgi:hypothetical protein